MNISFPNPYIQKIYHYIYLNDGHNIFYKDIMEALSITYPTVRKYIRWLEKRNIIKRTGKRIAILQ